jgi:hypothetical protein
MSLLIILIHIRIGDMYSSCSAALYISVDCVVEPRRRLQGAVGKCSLTCLDSWHGLYREDCFAAALFRLD